MAILGELWVKLGLKSDNLNKGLEESKGKLSGFSGMLGKMGGMVAAAFSAKAIFDFSKKVTELSNQMSGVKKKFDEIASPNLLRDLKKATNGTVSDLQLMQRVVQANNFKIPLDQLATYLKFATQRARESGQSVDYLVDSIVTGLGRQSVMILDNLGISAKEIRDNMKDGGTMADAVGKIIKESMGDAKDEIDEATLSASKFSASWQNLMAAIGYGTGIKNAFNSALGWMADKLDKATKVFELKTVGTGIKLMHIFSGGILGKSLINDEIAKQAISNTPDGPDVPKGFKYAANQDPTHSLQQEIEARNGLIQKLQDEIKAKEDIRNLSANEDEIRLLNDEIAKLEERLNVLRMTNEERMKYRNEQQIQIESVAMPKIGGPFDLDSMSENILQGTSLLEQGKQAWLDKGQELSEIALSEQERISDAASMISQALANGVSGSVNELANIIAGVEDANVGSVVSALLSPLADACVAAGTLIMVTGKGVEALRTALTNFLGIPAIAAGAVMVALGTAAKAGLAAIGNSAGRTATAGASNYTSYSGGYGVNPNNYSHQNNNYTLTTTLKGSDLLLAIEREQNNKRR